MQFNSGASPRARSSCRSSRITVRASSPAGVNRSARRWASSMAVIPSPASSNATISLKLPGSARFQQRALTPSRKGVASSSRKSSVVLTRLYPGGGEKEGMMETMGRGDHHPLAGAKRRSTAILLPAGKSLRLRQFVGVFALVAMERHHRPPQQKVRTTFWTTAGWSRSDPAAGAFSYCTDSVTTTFLGATKTDRVAALLVTLLTELVATTV